MARATCFVSGFIAVSIVFLGMFDIVRTVARGDGAYDPSAFVMNHFWVLLFQWSLIPALGALTGLLLADAVRPMVAFTPSSRRTYSLVFHGAIAAAIWIAVLMILPPAVNDMIPDSALLAMSAPIVTFVVLVFSTRRVRLGWCDGCGHDLRGSRLSGACPECGRSCKPDYPGFASAGG